MSAHRFPLAALATVVLLAACAGGPGTSDAPDTGNAPAGTIDASAEALPASLTFTEESGASASATVTAEDGGIVSATAADGTTFELDVPAEALAGEVEITMTPLTAVEGLGTEPGVVHAVQLEPEGQVFFDFLRLTITPADAIAVEEQVMFEAVGDGSEPIAALVDPDAEEVVVLVDHFTVEGVARFTPDQRALFMRKSAENAERRIRDQVGERLQGERREVLVEGAEGQMPDLTDLLDEWQREVVDKRREAASLSCQELQNYVGAALGFERQIQLLGASDDGEAASLERIREAVAFAQARYDECEKEAIARCQEADDSAILVAFWLSMERSADRDRAKQICEPSGFVLEFTGSGFPLRSANFATPALLDVEGRAQGCPADGGGWVFTGEMALDYSEGPADTTQNLVETTPGQTPEHFVLTPEFTVGGNTVEFTDALGQPTGELTYTNVFGDTVGPFPLDVVRTDEPCTEPTP